MMGGRGSAARAWAAAVALAAGLVGAGGLAPAAAQDEAERAQSAYLVRIWVYEGLPDDLVAKALEAEQPNAKSGAVAELRKGVADRGIAAELEASLVVTNRDAARLDRMRNLRVPDGKDGVVFRAVGDRIGVRLDVRHGPRPFLVRLDLRMERPDRANPDATVSFAIEQTVPCEPTRPSVIVVRSGDASGAASYVVLLEVGPALSQ